MKLNITRIILHANKKDKTTKRITLKTYRFHLHRERLYTSHPNSLVLPFNGDSVQSSQRN